MLQVKSFSFNPFQENTYLIINEKKQVWIVDPGMYEPRETQFLQNFISENQLIPQSIINTHTHLDHIFGVQALKDQYKIPFLIHEKELPVLNGAAGSAMLFGFDFKNIPAPDSFIKETELLPLGEDEMIIKLVPGHSPGSVLFYYPEGGWAISGDVLFQRSIGRTDLPGGDFETLIQSIKNEVFTLPDETTIYSGHGPVTTIGEEKAFNPFLKYI